MKTQTYLDPVVCDCLEDCECFEEQRNTTYKAEHSEVFKLALRHVSGLKTNEEIRERYQHLLNRALKHARRIRRLRLLVPYRDTASERKYSQLRFQEYMAARKAMKTVFPEMIADLKQE